MATKSFAIPLNAGSKQEGDITFEAMKNASTAVMFRLTYVTSNQSDNLCFKTKKHGITTDHPFYPTVQNNTAEVTLSKDDMAVIFNDANGGDWDYIGAHWSVGGVDVGATSQQYEIQNGTVYDRTGWPPKT